MIALLNGHAAVYPHLTTGVIGSEAILGFRATDSVHADTIQYVFTKEGPC